MAKQNFFIALFSLFFLQNILAQRITGIYTDFNYQNNGYWYANGSLDESSSQPATSDQPSNSHHLLAFTWNGITYTTGVNDGLLDSKIASNGFTKKSFRAFPVASLPSPVSSTYVGVGYNYGGAGDVVLANNSMEYYLTDGIRGFDLGTGIYNLPKTGGTSGNQPSKYTIAKIETADYTQPVVVISQMGQPGGPAAEDVFYFVNEHGAVVGSKKSVKFSDIKGVGWGYFKFYTINANGLNYTTSPSGSRVLRFIAYSLADFGINASNIGQIKQFWQELSGSSDQAFIGSYNTETMEIAQSVSGYIYKDGATTPNSPGYQGAVVKLFKADGTTQVAVSTTNAAGYYLFGDIPKGNYIIRVTVPGGQKIETASDSNNDTDIPIVVDEEPVTNTFFSINQVLPVDFGSIFAKVSGGRLLIDWSTLSETGNSHFEIEFSNNGKAFVKIGTVNSKAKDGNSDVSINYRFAAGPDSATGLLGLSLLSIALIALFISRKNKMLYVTAILVGMNLIGASCSKNNMDMEADSNGFIRIKQVDKDGTYQYSKVIKVIKE
ncbi:SdrD B-like domain-containing protein [Niabella aquatica]